MRQDAVQNPILQFFQLRESATIPELAASMKLPGSTVVGLVNRLVASGLLYRSEVRAGRRGRPTQVYRLRMPGLIAACEIEGTRISVAIFDQQLQLLAIEEKQFLRPSSAREARQIAERLLQSTVKKSGARTRDLLVVATSLNAVAIDNRAITSSVIPWAQDHAPLLGELAGVPVQLVINPTIISEYRKLDPQPPSLCLLRAGDGVSARLIGNGQLMKGSHSLAGELGHIVADPGGPLCGCGRRGCLETICSGPAIQQSAIDGLRQGPRSELRAEHLCHVSPAIAVDRIFRAWTSGDSFAHTVMETPLDQLAWAMGIAVNLFDPAMVLCGGYVLAGRKEWIDEIQRRATRWILHAGKRRLPVTSACSTTEDNLRALASQYHWLTVIDTVPAQRTTRTERSNRNRRHRSR